VNKLPPKTPAAKPLDLANQPYEMWEVVVDTRLGRICGRSTRVAIFLIFVACSLALVMLGLSKDNLALVHLVLIISFGLLISVMMFKKEGSSASSTEKSSH